MPIHLFYIHEFWMPNLTIIETQNIASLRYRIPIRHCISIRHRVLLHFPVFSRCKKIVATYDARPCAATCNFSKNAMFEISTKMHDIPTAAFDNIQILYPRIMDAIFDNCGDAIFCVSSLPCQKRAENILPLQCPTAWPFFLF